MSERESLAGRVARLSEPQKDALRHVRQAKKSEQIAAELGISKSAVDKRIEGAMRHLGVSLREIAALLLDQAEEGCDRHAADLDTVAKLDSLRSLEGKETPPQGHAERASERHVGLSVRQRLELIAAVAALSLMVFGLATVASQLFHGAIKPSEAVPSTTR